MELRKASAFVCLAGLLWHSPDAHAQETVTTVCELASDSEAHHAKTVKVSGRIVSDRIERTIIVDSSCPDVGVSVLIGGKSSTKNPRVVELFEAVFGGTPGIYEKHITVTLTGTFTHSGGPPVKNLLDVQDVGQLVVK